MSKASLLAAAAAVSLAAVLFAASHARAQGPSAGSGRTQPPPRPALTGDQLFALGRLDGLTYTNEHFGVTLTAPKGWTVIGLAELKAMREGAKAMFAGEKDPKVRRQFEETVERTTALFSASKQPPGSAGSFNATLVCAAERVPTAIVKTPRDYYTLMLNSMRVSQELDAEVLEAFETRRIGATDFGLFKLKLTTPRGVVIQKQLISIKPPYAFGIVLTYTEEADAAAFDEVLGSIRAR